MRQLARVYERRKRVVVMAGGRQRHRGRLREQAAMYWMLASLACYQARRWRWLRQKRSMSME